MANGVDLLTLLNRSGGRLACRRAGASRPAGEAMQWQLEIENHIANEDLFGTNWTIMDSITQQFFWIGLNWTLLG